MINAYALSATIILIFSCVELRIKSTLVKRILFWSFGIVPLIFFVGLRGGVDDDYYSYIKYFELAPTIGSFSTEWNGYREATSGVEIGFALAASFIRSTGGTPEQGIFIFAAINFLTVGLIISKYGVRLFYSLFVYYCIYLPVFFTHIRFSLALLLGFYGIIGVLTCRKKFISWGLVIVSPFIHIASIVFVPVIFCYRLCGVVKVFHFGVLCLLISLFFLLLDFTSPITYILSFIGGRYEFYIGAGAGSVSSALLRIFFLVLFICGLRDVDKTHALGLDSKYYYRTIYRILFMIYCLSTIVWSISWQVDVLYRLGLALQISMIGGCRG
ncbi:hypothetical protein AX279_20905 [Pseudomonas sp. J237]|nr:MULTISPECIES: EpsG family protein [Pseudomonas]OEO24270.1 hypothetical protein AX279_20905 [Pseudomonas sp. J237]